MEITKEEEIAAKIGSYHNHENVVEDLNGLAEDIKLFPEFSKAICDLASSEFVNSELYNPTGIWVFINHIKDAIVEGDEDSLLEVLKANIVLDLESINPNEERRKTFRDLHLKHIEENLDNFCAEVPIESWEKVVVVEASMYGGKTTTGIEIYDRLNKEGNLNLAPVIPSFMNQKTIHVRGKENESGDGHIELPALQLGLPKKLSNKASIDKFVNKFIEELVAGYKESELVVLLDEYSFLPPEFLIPLTEALRAEPRVHKIILAGLSHDIHHQHIPGYDAIRRQGGVTMISSCGAYIPGVDDLDSDPENWIPSSDCTNRYIPVRTGQGIIYLRDLHAPVVLPQMGYHVVYTPGTLGTHHSNFLENNGLFHLISDITNPTKLNVLSRQDELKKSLVKEA